MGKTIEFTFVTILCLYYVLLLLSISIIRRAARARFPFGKTMLYKIKVSPRAREGNVPPAVGYNFIKPRAGGPGLPEE